METIKLIKALREGFSKLPSRDRALMEMRLGIKFEVPETLERVGKEFGITRERVRKIEERSLENLMSLEKRSDEDK